jgi:hypothetical protein
MSAYVLDMAVISFLLKKHNVSRNDSVSDENMKPTPLSPNEYVSHSHLIMKTGPVSKMLGFFNQNEVMGSV